MIKDFSETIKNEAKGQKIGFLGMLLGTVGANLLQNLRRGKRTSDYNWNQTQNKGTGKGTVKVGEGTVRTSEDTVKAGEDL